MPANPERELARLRARFEHRAQELANVGFILRGTILERFSKCGSPGCACHNDPTRLHGPYWQWTAKIKGKTVTRNLNEQQRHRYEEWIDNGRRCDQIVQDLYEISAQADAILRNEERPKQNPQKKHPPRHRNRDRA